MRPVFLLAICALPLAGGERVVESVLTSLAYGSACWSSIELHNLGDREVAAEVEGHRSTGALVALTGQAGMNVRLAPGDKASFRLQVDEDTTSSWARIRELVPAAQMSPVLAIAGVTECVADNKLRTAAREVAYPARNPWYSSDVDEASRENVIALINTSERSAQASVCYSAGSLYSVPKDGRASDLVPVCSSSLDLHIPPFGSREIPVNREGNTHFSLKTQGDAIVLQMLRSNDPRIKLYTVNSTIKFGGEAPEP